MFLDCRRKSEYPIICGSIIHGFLLLEKKSHNNKACNKSMKTLTGELSPEPGSALGSTELFGSSFTASVGCLAAGLRQL